MTSKPSQTSGLAIASLVLSCLTVVIGPFGCLPGVICGHLARAECRRNSEKDGAGLALAGLIVGYVFIAVNVVIILLVITLYMAARSESAPFNYSLF